MKRSDTKDPTEVTCTGLARQTKLGHLDLMMLQGGPEHRHHVEFLHRMIKGRATWRVAPMVAKHQAHSYANRATPLLTRS